jgi:hypothetical protein
VKVDLLAAIIGAGSTKLGIVIGTAITVIAVTFGGIDMIQHKAARISPGPADNQPVLRDCN